ncbi:MAG: hypothetical protein ABI175_09225, partial [Polyangiales bacterium]
MAFLLARGAAATATSLCLLIGAACSACSSSDTVVVPADDDATVDSSSSADSSPTEVAADGARDTLGGADTSADGPSPDASPDAPLDTLTAPTCTDPTTFPTFGKGCTLDTHCSFGLHQLDCCGSLGAIGINHAFAEDFTKTEDAYRKTCAICDCLPKE